MFSSNQVLHARILLLQRRAAMGRPRMAMLPSMPTKLYVLLPDRLAAHRELALQVLQQHIEFFDLNGDGVITVLGTFIGFRLLNCNLLFSIFAALFIHSGLSYATLPPNQWYPDPFMRIYTNNIHRGKHGCDSGTYDCEGRFRPQLFADFFTKYGQKMQDGSGDWGMTAEEAMRGVWGQRCFMDWFGLMAASVECAFDIFVVVPRVLTRIERWLTGDLICQGSRHTLSSGPKTVSCVWRTCAVSSTAATSTRSPASAALRTVGRLLNAR